MLERRNLVRYVTVESLAYSMASGQGARLRLTYEVRSLRDGVESWFLVSMEEMQPERAPRLT